MACNENKESKNLLFLMVDCLGSANYIDDSGGALTPHMDWLQREGVTFPNCITSATYTTGSFVSMLSGLYPAAHGVRSLDENKLPEGCPSFPRVLQERGYITAAYLTGPLSNELHIGKHFNRFEHRSSNDTVFGKWGHEFLDKFPDSLPEPWCTVLHLWELHTPRRVAPQMQSEKFGKTSYHRSLSTIDAFIGRLLKKCDMDHTSIFLVGDHGEKLGDAGWTWPGTLARWMIQHAGPGEKLLKTITRAKTSRHVVQRLGIATHGYDVSDLLARVPLIIMDKGIGVAERRIDQQARTIDIPPTILEMLLDDDAPSDENIQGQSLLPILKNQTSKSPAALVETSVYVPAGTDLVVGYRTDRWKLVFSPDTQNYPAKLYNLQNDPEESRHIRDILGTTRLSARERQMQKERLHKLGYF
jgi:arylsulfatase A-like enzyme